MMPGDVGIGVLELLGVPLIAQRVHELARELPRLDEGPSARPSPRLEELVTGAERIFPVRRLTSNGLVAWAEVLQGGLEGYVAKDEVSPYVGSVTRSWLKVKVPGWTDPEDRWKRVRLGTDL